MKDGSRKLKGILKKQGDGNNTVHGPAGSEIDDSASPYLTVSGTGYAVFDKHFNCNNYYSN